MTPRHGEVSPLDFSPLLFDVYYWTSRQLHIVLYYIKIAKPLQANVPFPFYVSKLAELLLSTSMVPRTLTVFWIRVRDVSFGACLAQVLLVYFILLPSQ